MPITEENVNRLIAAMMRRGKRVPEVAEREAIIKSEHALGHFGERAILRAIEDKGFWWPYMLMNIREQLDSCNICKKNNIGQMGYHPQGSVLAERPGDLYQVDVMHMPESAEGHRYCSCWLTCSLDSCYSKLSRVSMKQRWHLHCGSGSK